MTYTAPPTRQVEKEAIAVTQYTQDEIEQAVQGDILVYDDGQFGLVGADGVARTRLGLSLLDEIARLSCKITSVAAPYLRRNLPENQLIIFLLDLISVLCTYLTGQADAIRNNKEFDAVSFDTSQLVADLRQLADKIEATANESDAS